MPAYMISQVTVTDQQKFGEYLEKTRSIASKYSARPIVIGDQPRILNGENDNHQMVFVIEFESMEMLEKWHKSDEYQALIPLREEGSDQHMVAYDAATLPGS